MQRPQPFMAPPLPQQHQDIPPRGGQPQQQQQPAPTRQQRPPQPGPEQPSSGPIPLTTTMAGPNTSRIVELSNIISYNTAVLDAHLATFKQPAYSFSQDAPANREPLIPAMDARRKAVEEATLELHELVQHPRSLAMDPPAKHAAKAFIAKFEIAKHVPPNGDISYGTLSEITGVEQGALESILRLAIAHRIFNESEQERGRIAHSPASRCLAEDFAIQAGKAFADDFFPMTAYITPALERFSSANEPTHSAAALASGGAGQLGFYEILDRYPDRANNFHSTMHMARSLPGLSWDHLVNGFEWASLPQGCLCVDVGGGHGQAAFAVAEKFPHLNWIVQDSRHGLRGHPPVPEGVNVAFMEQDFLQFQDTVTKGAGVFFLRWILHNWPDHYCHRILKGLIPSLQPGSRILIMETLLKAPGAYSGNMEERFVRARDVGQLALGNGRERDKSAWRRVVVGADPDFRRFKLERFREPEGSDLGIVELVWTGTGRENEGVAAGAEDAATASP